MHNWKGRFYLYNECFFFFFFLNFWHFKYILLMVFTVYRLLKVTFLNARLLLSFPHTGKGSDDLFNHRFTQKSLKTWGYGGH